MKFATPVMTVAAVLVLAASHQVNAAQPTAQPKAVLAATGSHALLVAQADSMSPREYRASEPAYAGAGKHGAGVAAQKGPEALRRYIDRTRMIYALDYTEFARF